MDDNFFDEEDLVVASGPSRNWKGIIIAVLVIASILSLIITSIVILTPPDEGPRVKGRRFELDDVFGPQFQPLLSNGSWISDDEWLFRDAFGGASVLNLVTNTTTNKISPRLFDVHKGVDFSLSADGNYALLVHDVTKTHRFSFRAKYTVVDMVTKGTYELNPEEGGEKAGKEAELQLAKWGPLGNALVLVQGNDIYYKASAGDSVSHQLTRTGENDTVFNGVPDWLYEEEILETNSAVWFSKDGQRLLYITFNDSDVGEHHILQYGSNIPGGREEYIYPKVKTLRYPKPGTPNPTVTITVCDLWRQDKFFQRQFKPPGEIANKEHYITSAGWISGTEVGVVWVTRSYHLSLISICSVLSGSCTEEYRISSGERRGWVANVPFPMFSTWTNSSNFITTAPIRDGEKGFFDHLVLVDTANKRSHPISHGNFDVVKMNAWDEDNKLVYFIATPADHPNERHLYSVKMDQPFMGTTADCISCTFYEERLMVRGVGKSLEDPSKPPPIFAPDPFLSGLVQASRKSGNLTKAKQKEKDKEDAKEAAEKAKINPPFSTARVGSPSGRNSTCTYVSDAHFSPGKDYFILQCGGPNIPFEASYAIGNYPTTPVRLLQVTQPNDALIALSNEMAFPEVRIFPVHLHSGAYAQVRLLLPPGLREDEITQFPMILNVFGAPGTQLAVDKWLVDFGTFLASKKEYIVVQIDGSGSGGRGWDYRHQVYYNLGHLEAHDQIEVIRHLRDSLAYVETNKIGIWGWSYGGYLTASIMTSRDTTDLFQCGASIAPMAKWSIHDSTYSEKYMGTANVTDNYKGYAHTDITRNVANLAKKAFYLIHGTGDENVHIQHSMLLAKALIEKKILFRQQVYPDEPHTFTGAKIHVHQSLEEFFEDCFRKQIAPEVESVSKGGKFDDFD